MTHFQVHELERKIASLLKKNFSRPPSPHEKSYDDGDFLQMGHDITDMLLGSYFITPHPTDEELDGRVFKHGEFPKAQSKPVDKSLSSAVESAAWGLEGLARALNEMLYKGPLAR